MDPTTLGWYAVLLVGVGVSSLAVLRSARPGGRWGITLRRRLLMGVRWGTLIAAVGIACFYLFVQDGLANPYAPVEIPFRAYSYLYPLGILTSGFAHSGLGHLTGNLLATLVFGSLAEYAWSHFPRERGRSSFSTPMTNPLVRVALWACAVATAGVVTSVFSLGPTIGFSGVVFAFVGFAVIRYPIPTAVAALSTTVLSQLYYALRTPVLRQTATESFSAPWWANVAVHGHALGLLLGAAAGIAFAYRRDVRPRPAHLWIAALAFGIDRGLWAIYLPEGSETYRLFRALGVAAVFVLAALLVVAATASDRELLPRIALSRREAAVGLLAAVVLSVAFVAVPLNLYAVEDPRAGLGEAESVEIEDYDVFYAEDVENQFVPAVPLPAGENRTTDGVEAAGVIVVSERRNIWWEEVSAARLASRGTATVRLGGVGWHRDVRANRTTWALAGGNETYNVRLGPADAAERPVVFRAEPARANAVVDGRNLSIVPEGEGFRVAVTGPNETRGVAALPAHNGSTTISGLTIVREERDLFVERGETRVRVARQSR